MTIDVYNQSGEIIGKADLPDDIFSLKLNHDLVHQAVTAQLSNARNVLAHTKDRGEVQGGGIKPWRQKGTGRARHGSIRSPLWKGGGVTFGPSKDRNFSCKINKKMRRKALFMALSSKVADNQIMVLDNMKVFEPKTKQASQVLNNLAGKLKDYKTTKKKNDRLLLVVAQKDQKLIRSITNLSFVKLLGASDLNVLDVLSYKFLLMEQGSIPIIKEVFKL